MNRSAASNTIALPRGAVFESALPATWLERWAAPALALIAIVPVLVSLYFFLGASLRLDEAQSLWQVSRSVSGILTIVAGDVHVPLYHILLHYWLLLFGDTIGVARLLSLSFFVLAIPAFYLLGKRAYSTRVGLLAAFLFAISPFMNWYANEIRMYTMFVFFTILNQYFFVRLFNDAEPTRRIWVLYGITAILGAFSHYFFFLNLFAQAVFFALRRHLFPASALRSFIGIGVLLAAVFVPWISFELFRGVVGFQEPILALPSTVDLFGTFSQFLFGFQRDVITTIFLSLWPLAAIVALVSLGHRMRIAPQTEYFTLTLIIAFGATFLGSYLITPVYVSRYLIFTIPSLYLVIINLFSTYRTSARLLAEGALVLLMLMALGVEMTSPNVPVKEQYAGAAQYLASHATAQDVVLVSAPFTIYPLEYYYRGPAAMATLPVWNQYAYGPIPAFDPTTFPKDVAEATRNYQTAYLLLSYNQGYESEVKQYFDSHYERLSSQTFSDDLTLYAYRLRYNTEKSAIATSL
jgi:mannosyltransferase